MATRPQLQQRASGCQTVTRTIGAKMLTLERIDYWDRCIADDQVRATAKEFPEEALLLFGPKALSTMEPSRLAFILYARRIMLMTDSEIRDLQDKLQRENTGIPDSCASGFYHYSPQDATAGNLVPSSHPAAEPEPERTMLGPQELRNVAKTILRTHGLSCDPELNL